MADAVAVPKLSEKANEALAFLSAAKTVEERTSAFEAARADRSVREELRSFAEAIRQRFGHDVVRHVRRRGSEAAAPSSVQAEATREQVKAAARAFHAVQSGERAQEQVYTERLATRENLRQGSGLKCSGDRLDFRPPTSEIGKQDSI